MATIKDKKTKDITPSQYASLRNQTLANITKHIRNGNALQLPHVIRLKNWGRFYLLEVPESLTKTTFSQNLIKYTRTKGKIHTFIKRDKILRVYQNEKAT